MESSGTIVKLVHDRWYFIAEDDWDGGEVFCHFNNVVDAPRTNNHTCLYQITVPVLYTISGFGKNRCGNKISLDPNYPIELQTVEESILESWQGSFGFLQRPCGCTLFVHEKNFTSLFDKHRAVGKTVRHEVANDGVKCLAVNAEIV